MSNDSDYLPDHKAAFAILIITVFLVLPVGLAFNLFLGKSQLLLGEIFIILPAAIYVRRKKFPFLASFRLRGTYQEVLFASLLVGISVPILVDELDRLVQLIFPMPEELMKAVSEILKAKSILDLIIIIFSSVVIAGLFEEMFFRGFIQGALERNLDVTKAVVLTAILFALLHANPWWALQITILGLTLGLMAWKSDSILPAAIVHGMNNGISIYFANVNEAQIGWYLWKGHVAPFILLLSGILAVMGFKLFYRYCEEEKASRRMFNQEKYLDNG